MYSAITITILWEYIPIHVFSNGYNILWEYIPIRVFSNDYNSSNTYMFWHHNRPFGIHTNSYRYLVMIIKFLFGIKIQIHGFGTFGIAYKYMFSAPFELLTNTCILLLFYSLLAIHTNKYIPLCFLYTDFI